jgi:hypothetical protein
MTILLDWWIDPNEDIGLGSTGTNNNPNPGTSGATMMTSSSFMIVASVMAVIAAMTSFA